MGFGGGGSQSADIETPTPAEPEAKRDYRPPSTIVTGQKVLEDDGKTKERIQKLGG